MNKKIKLNIFRILFIISLIICLLLISDTYAKYQEQMDTSYKSMIKRWKVIVNNEIIRNQTDLTKVVTPVFKDNKYVSDDVIVPGREGYFDMNIDFSKVDVPFTVEFTVEQEPQTDNVYNNLADFQFYGYYVEETDTFYYNLPEEYQQVEYIESNGSQYIDTGILADSDVAEVVTNFELVKDNTTMWLGGAENIDDENILKTYPTMPYIENKNMYFYAGQDEKVAFKELESGKYYKVIQTYTDSAPSDNSNGGNLKVTVDNTEIFNDSFSGTIKNNRNIWLFANNDENGNYNYSSIKLKEFKYYKDNSIALELVPCYRIEDGVIGMFDIVSGRFLTNSGTGNFSKGEDIEKVIINPELEKYKDLKDEEKNTNVKAYVRWVDGDGTSESLVDILNNTEDTAFVENVMNTEVKYKATAVFEQYIEE